MKYSELDAILKKVSEYPVTLPNILERYSKTITETDPEITPEQKSQRDILARQLMLQRTTPAGHRYCAQTMIYDALNLFLRNTNCYRELRKLLSLPDCTTLRNYFGKLGTPGTDCDCKNVISSVFFNLEGLQKYC